MLAATILRAETIPALKLYRGSEIGFSLPSLCKVTNLQEIRPAYSKFRYFESEAKGLYFPVYNNEPYLIRSQSKEYIAKKTAYVHDFLSKFKSDPDVLTACCRENKNCKAMLAETKVMFVDNGRTRFEARNNVIYYDMAGLILENFLEDIESTLVHEMGHACDLAYQFGKTGDIETGHTKPSTIENVIGPDFLQCLHQEDDDVNVMGEPVKEFWSRFFGWGSLYTEAFAEAVFAKYRPTPWHWLDNTNPKIEGGYKMGSTCLFKVPRLKSQFCQFN